MRKGAGKGSYRKAGKKRDSVRSEGIFPLQICSFLEIGFRKFNQKSVDKMPINCL